MKNLFITTLLLTLLFSCNQHEDKIEIYLLKERVRSSEGIPVLKYAKLKNIKHENLKNIEDCNYDSITKSLIFGGKFHASEKDIQQKPLIEDNEILTLDLNKSEVILSEAGKRKISHIKPNMKYGVQFVICVNKKPCLTGYFRSNISSNIYNWNYIGYDYFEHEKATLHDDNFVIRQNIGYGKWKPILCDLNNYAELVSGFRKTNRIIEKASR